MQRINLKNSNVARQWRIRTSGSRGFTLVELLIVIGLIIFLMAIIGVVAMNSLGTAKIAATKGTVAKVQGLLQQRLDAVMRKDPEKILTESLTPRFAGNRKIAEAISRKYTLRQAFPQTWAEAQAYFPGAGPMANPPLRPQESGEVLYYLLTQANILGYPPEGEGAFNSTEVRDTDGNGFPEFIDAWERPLRFYRWPTRLVRGGAWSAGGFAPSGTARAMMPALPTTTTDLMHDSDDRFGLLQTGALPPGNRAWYPIFRVAQIPPAHITYFENGLAPAPTAMNPSPFYQLGAFHTLETTSLPLIISAGPDGVTGLYEPNDVMPTTTFGYLGAANPSETNNTYDNISNFNSRSGGK